MFLPWARNAWSALTAGTDGDADGETLRMPWQGNQKETIENLAVSPWLWERRRAVYVARWVPSNMGGCCL